MAKDIIRWLIIGYQGDVRLLQSFPARLGQNEQAIKLLIHIPDMPKPKVVDVALTLPDWPEVTYEVSVGDET